ncbi:MAG TPA: DUF3999 domain-containing protein [Xanthomonadaceae bacterium]|nr:DUF3999 domain-containing protein [Xanthomonadaceae bacterium]
MNLSSSLRRRRRAVLLVAACTSTLVLAAARADFAWQWPIDTAGRSGVFSLALTPEVYRQLAGAGLDDVVAFNTQGDEIPFGPVSQLQAAAQPREREPYPAPWFPVPVATTTGAGDTVSLHIEKGPDGRLRRLDAEFAAGDPQRGAHEIVVDLSQLDASVRALELDLDLPADASFSTRLDVSASHDLSNWRPIASGQAVLALTRDGQRLERRRIELPVTAAHYLRLSPSGDATTPPLAGVRALLLPDAGFAPVPAPERLQLEGRADADEDAAGVFVYDSGGPFPIERIDVVPAQDFAVADVVVSSRGSGQAPWRERARMTVFRLADDGDAFTSLPVAIAPVRDRQWRIQTRPAQRHAPRLHVEYTPDQFLVMTQGPAPYALAAGSAKATRAPHPLQRLVAEVRDARRAGWTPAAATLGTGQALAGEAARQASREIPWRQLLLWSVLVAGAVLLVVMVLRLLRQAPRS